MSDYDIVLASDEGYAAHLATTVVSIGESNGDIPICIHILDGGMQEQTLDKIYALRERYPNLSFMRYEATDSILSEKLWGG